MLVKDCILTNQSPVKKLNIYNFRNIKNLCFCPGKGLNIIYGDNARGKTNLIESIWMFTGEKSFRKAKESQLILFGEKNARLDLEFFAESRIQNSTIKFIPQKEIFLNKCKIEKLTDFIGIFTSIVFSPEDLTLIKGGPQKRRNFLNVAISQVKPKYSKLMLEYTKILIQRNALLKDIFKYHSLLETLDVWDTVFIKIAASITKYRLKYIKALLPIVKEIYGKITEKKEKLEIKYVTSINLPIDIDFEELVNYFTKKIISNRNIDIKMGYTQFGPHRDDFDITINNLIAKNFASQGQQRSIVLALKLAEAEILKNLANKNPIILLDDVMSELDSNRKKYILDSLKNSQCFITCCDKAYFKNVTCENEMVLYKIDDLIDNKNFTVV